MGYVVHDKRVIAQVGPQHTGLPARLAVLEVDFFAGKEARVESGWMDLQAGRRKGRMVEAKYAFDDAVYIHTKLGASDGHKQLYLCLGWHYYTA